MLRRPTSRRKTLAIFLAIVTASLVAGALTTLISAYVGRARHVSPGIVIVVAITSALTTGLPIFAALFMPDRPDALEPSRIPGPAFDHEQPRPNQSRRAAFRRWTIPRQLPAQQFFGRQKELADLSTEYTRQIGRVSFWSHRLHSTLMRRGFFTLMPFASRASSQRRMAILLIHGMPGVGKTALAQTFARTIARRYKDGQLYANLEIGRERRSPGDVLQDFLKAMGEKKLPGPTGDRAKLFRSITANRRVLVVLDAARGYDQVRYLLPGGTDCAVIITSKWSLGSELGAFEYVLNPPDASEANELLAAFSNMERSEAGPESARIIEYCGALPMALRIIGEHIAEGHFSVVSAAERLEENPLSILRHRGRDVEERIISEYDQLPHAEQAALQLFALVESPTFGPWVLTPLTRASLSEAESLTASLADHHMLSLAGRAADTGLARYSIHPLVRLVARKRFNDAQGPQRIESVIRELDAAYLSAARVVLARIEPGSASPDRWRTELAWTAVENVWVPRVLSNLDHWVRTEYRNLIRASTLAYERREWGSSWRIAARLGACVADGLKPAESIAAFGAAKHAAELDSSLRGAVEVLLAQGSFLIALERYREAFDGIAEAIDKVRTAIPPFERVLAYRLEASAHRRLAEAWLQLGAYASARKELDIALGKVQEVSNEVDLIDERARVNLLIAENDTWLEESKWFYRQPYEDAFNRTADGSVRFRSVLGLAEDARRRGHWQDAQRWLEEASKDNYGDSRRVAAIQYRMARLLVHQASASSAERRFTAGHEAVIAASDASRLFYGMKNQVGIVRARVILVRALMMVDRKEEAHDLAKLVENDLHTIPESNPERLALQARVRRCQGEVLLSTNDWGRASAVFTEAIDLYEREGDWRSANDTRLLLGSAQQRAGQYEVAQANLHQAAWNYEKSGDHHAYMIAKRRYRQVARRQKRYFFFEITNRPGYDLVTAYLYVPKTSSTSCDQAVFVDQATGVSLPSDVVPVEIDRFG